ncbi:MAG: hypothetical protein ABIH11_04710 [Candidatus Altiarchaeota archaeon]
MVSKRIESVSGQLQVVYSYIHTSGSKVTSLTISMPKTKGDRFCMVTFSDKVNIIRVKLSMDEIAGLADSIGRDAEWNCYHTFKSAKTSSETRMQYGNSFINAEKDRNRVALKLTGDEKASLKLVFENIFSRLI